MKLKPLNAFTTQAPVTAWWLAINKQYENYIKHLRLELFNYQVSQR